MGTVSGIGVNIVVILLRIEHDSCVRRMISTVTFMMVGTGDVDVWWGWYLSKYLA